MNCAICDKSIHNEHSEGEALKCLKELTIHQNTVNQYLDNLKILMNPDEHKHPGVRTYE